MPFITIESLSIKNEPIASLNNDNKQNSNSSDSNENKNKKIAKNRFFKITFQGVSEIVDENDRKQIKFIVKKYQNINFCDDILLIEYLKQKSCHRYKVIAKYEMMLEGLDILNSSRHCIDDYLINPNTNSLLKDKVYFIIYYDMSDIRSIKNNKRGKRDEDELTESDISGETSDSDEEHVSTNNDEANRATTDIDTRDDTPADFSFGVFSKVVEFYAKASSMAMDLTKKQANDYSKYINMNAEDIVDEVNSWLIRIKIIKLRELSDVKENTLWYCTVSIDEEEQYETKRKNWNDLHFNEVFTYRINDIKSQELFNKCIKVVVIYKKYLTHTDFGSFQIDLGTVFNQKDHSFYHKWAPILNEKCDSEENIFKGFIKCDIELVRSGQIQTQSDKINKREEDDRFDIENHLIFPDAYYMEDRTYTHIKLKVHIRAGEFSITDEFRSLYDGGIKDAVLNVSKIFIDSTDDERNQKAKETIHNKLENIYVKVIYGNKLWRSTKIRKIENGTITWNQDFEIKILFPPLIRCLKIYICQENTFSDTVLGTEYIYIDEISNPLKTNSKLPTFGPSYIDIYTDPYICKKKKKLLFAESVSYTDNKTQMNDDVTKPKSQDNHQCGSLITFNNVNRNLFVGRLLLELTSKMAYDNSKPNDMTPIDSNFNRKTEFIAYASIYEVSMIDKRYQNGLLSFKLTCGPFGYDVDPAKDSVKPNCTNQLKPNLLMPNMPSYLPFEKMKQCLMLKFAIENTSHVLHKMNFITHKSNKLKTIFEKLKKLDNKHMDAGNADALQKILVEYEKYISNINKYLRNYGRVACTDLDKNRLSAIDGVLQRARNLKNQKLNNEENQNPNLFKENLSKLRSDMEIIASVAKETTSLFPALNLWLLHNNHPIGLCSIEANDIIWSDDDRERGVLSAKLIYTDINSVYLSDLNDQKNFLKQNIARIRAAFWLGELGEVENAIINFPKNYEITHFHTPFRLPKGIYYQGIRFESHRFQLRTYLYRGSNMIGLDYSGLSDPYVVIKFYNQSVTSERKEQTNNPVWNITLNINEVILYGDLESIINNPPEVIVEIFDHDRFYSDEIMGVCYVKPLVCLDALVKPKLRWHLVYYKNRPQTGELLAAFQLIELKALEQSVVQANSLNRLPFNILNNAYKSKVNEKENQTKKEKSKDVNFESIPSDILPDTERYVLEVLFWGIRDLKDASLFKSLPQNKPTVEIEVGEKFIKREYINPVAADLLLNSDYMKPSRDVENGFENVNFNIPHCKTNISLLKDDEFKPNLHIKCTRTLNFHTKKDLIGSYTLESTKFKDCVFTFEKLKEKYERIEANLGKLNKHMIKRNYNESILHFKMQQERNENATNANNANKFLEKLTWWSKYYASVNNNDEGEFYNRQQNQDLSNMQSNLKNKKLDEIKVVSEKQKKATLIKKKYQSFRNTRHNSVNSLKKLLPESTNTTNSLPHERIPLLQNENKSTKQKLGKMNIEKIKIYDCELEIVEDLKDCFTEYIESYPLYKGKNIGDQQNQIQCYFKGKFMLYKESDVKDCFLNIRKKGGFLAIANGLSPFNTPVTVKVRIYVIKVTVVDPANVINKCKPYLYFKWGDQNLDDSANVKDNNTNKEFTFAKCFEIKAKFPYESQLIISVRNSEMFSRSVEIGRTRIDLEERYYSRSHATCGLPKTFDTTGYNCWRDSSYPTQILEIVCKDFLLDNYEHKSDENSMTLTVIGTKCTKEYIYEKPTNLFKAEVKSGTSSKLERHIEMISNNNKSEFEDYKKLKNIARMTRHHDFNNPKIQKHVPLTEFHMKEQLALNALNDWKALTGQTLIPEHLETRRLFKMDTSEVEGKIEMWIDMFDGDDSNIPKAVDIETLKPAKYQLRVIIKNAKDVWLDDENLITGEKTSDVYIKGWIGEQQRNTCLEQTDVHKRSTGEANFNYRFIFDFDYIHGENKILVQESNYFRQNERKEEPYFNLEVWDYDYVTQDDLLGTLKLNLSDFLCGTDSHKTCDIEMITENSTCNLFEERRLSGWWPVLNKIESNRIEVVTGKVEAEFILLAEEDAKKKPVGRAHEGPEALSPPRRPDESFVWFLEPLKSFKYNIWKHHKCLIIKIIIVVLLVLFVIVFLYQFPSVFVQRIFKVN